MFEKTKDANVSRHKNNLARLDVFLADFNVKLPDKLNAQINKMAMAIDDVEAKKPGTGWYVTAAKRQEDVKARRAALEQKRLALNDKLKFVDSAAISMYRAVIATLINAFEKIEKDYVSAVTFIQQDQQAASRLRAQSLAVSWEARAKEIDVQADILTRKFDAEYGHIDPRNLAGVSGAQTMSQQIGKLRQEARDLRMAAEERRKEF